MESEAILEFPRPCLKEKKKGGRKERQRERERQTDRQTQAKRPVRHLGKGF